MITGIPIKVRGSMVTASSVAYPDVGEALWVNGIAYVMGDTRSYLIGDLYHKFECKLNHTSDTATGKMPEAYPDDEANLYWIDLGAVNKYAPFQLERNTQNSANSPYYVNVNPGERVKEIALGNVIADDVTLEVFDAGTNLVYTESKRMLVREIKSINDWIYEKHRQVKKALFTNLPTFSTHTFKLTFTRAAGNVSVGFIIPAVAYSTGDAEFGADVKRENYSLLKRDEFGEAKLKPKRNIPNIGLTISTKKTDVDKTVRLLDDLNAQVTFWSGIIKRTDGYFESLFTIGFYSDFSYRLDNHKNATIKLEIKEL